jgi:predicted patatin/cPLA2 family phospholipase
MAVFRDQNAVQNQNTKPDNKAYERVKRFRYLASNVMDQNSLYEGIKSRLKSGNAKYFVFQFAIRKHKRQGIQIYNFADCYDVGVKLGRSQ